VFLNFYNTRVIQKLKIQNGWGGRKSPPRRYYTIPLIAQTKLQALVFAFKETSGRPEVSPQQRGEKQRHYMVAFTGGRVPQHQNTKIKTRLNKCLDKVGDYAEK
jgi:hypothetical protein